MVIFVIDVDRLSLLNLEGNTPVTTDLHGPCPRTLTFKFVQFQAGQIHIIKSFSRLEKGENSPEPRDMVLIDTC